MQTSWLDNKDQILEMQIQIKVVGQKVGIPLVTLGREGETNKEVGLG